MELPYLSRLPIHAVSWLRDPLLFGLSGDAGCLEEVRLERWIVNNLSGPLSLERSVRSASPDPNYGGAWKFGSVRSIS